MHDGNTGFRHFVVNRSIGSKIGAGFAVVLAILAISSATAWLAFGWVNDTLGNYAGLVVRSAIYRDIDKTVAQYRGHVREYVYSNNEATADTAIKEGETLRELIAGGLTRVANPERHSLLESMAKQAEAYAAGFAHVRELNVEQAKIEAEVMDVTGQQMTDGFSAIADAANKAGNTDLLLQAADGRRLSLLARLDANKRLGRHDMAAEKSANGSLDALRRTLQSIGAATKESDLNATAAAEAKLVDTYQSAFQRAAALDAQQVSLVDGAMHETGDALEENSNKAEAGNLADQAVLEKETIATTNSGSQLVLVLGLAAVAIGAVLAWLIGRGISRPVVRMCVAMRALAGGDKTVEIPGVGRKDEIGQMADTVQVFKDNMIEADRLREANERQKAEAEAERKAGMVKLADTFEASIKGVVNSVASQATEMQSAAQSMTHTAEQATEQATAVAASVEQASANVQTVATAAEELSASVLEIGRQVEQSSKIANQAVGEADRTNTTVEGLNHAAQRIGEVVQLIETIAGQTNLLARNATIEAARAGDAGKGFAVVASEVKSLASQTAKATEEIRAQIGEIQGATGQTVEAIHTIGATIRQMSEIATTIASAVEEQGAATREIATNVHQAAQGTGDIATNIGGVSRAASDTGAAATQVLSSAGELARQSETLRHDVDDFLATVRAA
jgi:methyl-accepting chemotaxis protein